MERLLKRIKKYTIVLVVLFVSCESLETENINDLDNNDVYNDPNLFPSIIDGGFLTFWQNTHLTDPGLALGVASQTMTSSHANWGMRDLGTIPKIPIINETTYQHRGFMTTPWYGLNASLVQANDVLRVTNENFGGQIEDADGKSITNHVLANGKMLQGLSLGWLGLLFDQAFIIDETTAFQLDELRFSPYDEVVDFAANKLIEAASIFENDPTTFHIGIYGLDYNNVEAAAFCRAYAAKFLAYKSRTAQETIANDWDRILSLINQGTQEDIAVVGNASPWISFILIYGQLPHVTRVSQRMINMMEGGIGGPVTQDPNHPTAPYPWPDGVSSLPEIENPRDNRLNEYCNYNLGIPFVSDRGYYFFSNYSYSRHISFLSTASGPMQHLTVNEQNMIKAEALVRTGGSKVEAAQLVNATRVDIGGLPPLTGTETDEEIIKAIYYERLVEFSWDAAASGWFFRRMTTENQYMLHPGTPNQMPVPAQELETLNIEVYTFGGN